jgi:hypothetical protein
MDEYGKEWIEESTAAMHTPMGHAYSDAVYD